MRGNRRKTIIMRAILRRLANSEKPLSTKELTERLADYEVSLSTVRNYTSYLHHLGLVEIDHYQPRPGRGPHIPVWRLKQGVDLKEAFAALKETRERLSYRTEYFLRSLMRTPEFRKLLKEIVKEILDERVDKEL